MKIFLDGADLTQIDRRIDDPAIAGLTTNPSLMLASGLKGYTYQRFAELIIQRTNKPVSFEVLADDEQGILEQARTIAGWGDNVFVKVPVINTKGDTNLAVISQLAREGVKVNVTALLSFRQIKAAARSLDARTPAILSVFCGRIADTGRDPVPFITTALHAKHGLTEILWASTREVYNVKQAEQCGADIITMSPALIEKMSMFGKDLDELSRETVTQFFNDGKGFSL